LSLAPARHCARAAAASDLELSGAVEGSLVGLHRGRAALFFGRAGHDAVLVQVEPRLVGRDELLVVDSAVAVGVSAGDEGVDLLLGHAVETLLREVAAQSGQVDRANVLGVEQPEGLQKHQLA